MDVLKLPPFDIFLQGANVIGSGISFYLGPKYVPFQLDPSGRAVSNDVSKEAMKGVIQNYLTTLAAVAWVGMAIAVIYFPARPPSPPGPVNKLANDQVKEDRSSGHHAHYWRHTHHVTDRQLWLFTV